MDTILPFALLCFTSFFTLTNPLGTMPVFLTMTHGMTDKERQSVVSRATLVAFITIMVFTFAGQFLFKFFGISTNGFRIAGGVIIFKIGFDMLQARYTQMKLKDEEIKTYADDISVTPLGDSDALRSRCHSKRHCVDAGCPYYPNERCTDWYDRLYLLDYIFHLAGLYAIGKGFRGNGK